MPQEPFESLPNEYAKAQEKRGLSVSRAGDGSTVPVADLKRLVASWRNVARRYRCGNQFSSLATTLDDCAGELEQVIQEQSNGKDESLP